MVMRLSKCHYIESMSMNSLDKHKAVFLSYDYVGVCPWPMKLHFPVSRSKLYAKERLCLCLIFVMCQ